MTSFSAEWIESNSISTHILTKRMTKKEVNMEVWKVISTHILTKRMTIILSIISILPFYFNSHPHEEDDNLQNAAMPTWRNFNSHPHEEDDAAMSSKKEEQEISTHILTKRMTATKDMPLGAMYISTHILTKRMTVCWNLWIPEGDEFQLTSSRRGWLNRMTGYKYRYVFQLTSSRRGWHYFH